MRPNVAASAARVPARRIRGAASGALAAVGALLAHLVGGGRVELVPGIVVLGLAIPAGCLLTHRRPVGFAPLVLLAAGAQTLGHLCLLMAPGGHVDHAHHGGGATPSWLMLTGHAAVALAVAAVASGLDRALVNLLGGLLARLIGMRPGRLRLPVVEGVATSSLAALRRSVAVLRIAPTRGPPPAAGLRHQPALR